MNGADLILKTAIKNGIEICLANAGTTEISLVAASDRQPGIRTVLGLFEGVCTGGADGYGRVLDRPAMTLLHLGPGLANGIACLHDARRAESPIVNIIGEHASWHRDADPPLNMNIRALAGTVSGWTRTCRSGNNLSRDTADVIAASKTGQIATLIIPSNYQSSPCTSTVIYEKDAAFSPIDEKLIEDVSSALRKAKRSALLLGGRALRKEGLRIAEKISILTGCDLLANTFPGYLERGISLPVVKRIPYFPEGARDLMGAYDVIIRIGAHEPVTFFGYDGIPSSVIPNNTPAISIGESGHDVISILNALAESLGTRRTGDTRPLKGPVKPSMPSGILTAQAVCATIAACQPEGAIIVDEGITTTFPYASASSGAAPHSLLTIAGGSIGYGLPCAVGASLAAPDRPVINIQADGSAMYTVQALWTMARESLNVTILICNNGGYQIIATELNRAGITNFGENTRRLVDIDRPAIDWISLSRSMGVPAVRVEDTSGLARELTRSIKEPGPNLIEMIIRP
ncbi:MAG: acetolactate synthase large subunit [Syntrophorhabdaceae bacterium]